MTQELREKLIDLLQTAYSAELETAENYLSWSVNLDGLHAQTIKEMLAKDVQVELAHARLLAERIYVLGGVVPGSMQLNKNQRYLQPSQEQSGIDYVVRGVVTAEESAIQHYRLLAEMAEGADPATQDLAVRLLADEEMHRREFTGILREIEDREVAAGRMSEEEKHCLTY
ncbi:hypothetical protein JIN77_10780 [Verrucomicrobiaceae bacterium R5-34]|uniref:Ferritin-like diiron domain-containing protein n=1 Tax=Oceaniferula flava TaxID=2800421 RepID=A0AAE2SDF5_9BACT|nr:ferritin-like domain-containing protein [Oceaniferula flavus]MBK1831213.1 hypothetical protein [Verrucomicrobiaceae bacterium R5-34]MBK1855382.1 hypothetical protein [Oceaniferula flavus]MBM1136688.1 hypothetical protein [Oceaniferula flavus]